MKRSLSRTPRSWRCGVLLFAWLLPGICAGQVVRTELQKLLPTDLSFGCGDGFGGSVAIDGDWIAVGAQLSCRGSVYLFQREDGIWVERQRVGAPTGLVLGNSVAMGGGLLVAGDPKITPETPRGAGEVHVWHLEAGTWVWEPETVQSSEATEDDGFGVSVSIDDDRLVVGATGAGFFPFARAYVFRREAGAWVEEAALGGSDTESSDVFGRAVSIAGDLIVVGAPLRSNPVQNAGAAYVFRRIGTTWTQEAKLTASDMDDGDIFGTSVSVVHETILVGASGNDDAGTSSGSAYVFRFLDGEWVEDAKLTASDAARLDRFGVSLSVGNGVIIVGASEADAGASDAGAAYVFVRGPDGWFESSKLVASEPSFGGLGLSASLADVAVVGAGASAYVFPIGNGIPTVDVWGVIVMAILMLAAGSVIVATRRRGIRA